MIKKIICAFLITTTMLSFTACASIVNSINTVTKEETENSNDSSSDSEESGLVDFLKDLETKDDNEDTEENFVYVEGMVGKTFAELLDSGYTYVGYVSSGDECSFNVSSNSVNDENKNIAQKLEGKTVKQMIDNGLDIDYWGLNGRYTFSTTVGDMEFKFDIDDAIDIVSKYKQEDSFADLKDMTEIYNMKLSNVEIEKTKYTVKLDDSFDASKFKNGNMFEINKEEIKDCGIKEIYYKSAPKDLFN
ncbi:MAG: hypothetical protein UHY68_08490 [Acutalibacteraceae bacterium]|nr:hypothetical protein [Acutalibacteraceae bacterium]